jgi:hypothetical protein
LDHDTAQVVGGWVQNWGMTMNRWFIPVNIVIGAVLGCTLGYLMALLVRPPPQFFNFFVIMVGIGKLQQDNFPIHTPLTGDCIMKKIQGFLV